MSAFHQDLRHGLRGLMKQPGITLIAVLSLALGIGTNTAISSVVNAVLLDPMPGTKEPSQLVRVIGGDPSDENNQYPLSPADFLDLKQGSEGVFESIAALWYTTYTLTGQGEPESVLGWQIQADYFRTIGIQPRLGRLFTPEEHEPGGRFVALLGHNLWQRRFGGDPKIVGEQIRINGESYKVTHGNQKHKNGPFDRVHKDPGLSFFRSLIFEFEGDIFTCPPYMKPPIHA